jgi:hypothetical protein
MVIYKYSLLKEIKLLVHNYRNKKDLIKKDIVFIDFNFWNFIILYYRFRVSKIKMPHIDIPEDVICYIVSCGTWGAYKLPNKIFICLNEIGNLSMSLEDLILHEIIHLRLEASIKDMDFHTKEDKVNKEAENLKKECH